MPGVKPEIAVDWARALAERELEGGEIARAFAVTTGGEEYVLRFNRHMGANFEKVVSLCQLAAPTCIPMAPLVYPRCYLRRRAADSPEMPRFAERLRGYKLYIGLDALRFSAKAGREDAYRFARERALAAAGAAGDGAGRVALEAAPTRRGRCSRWVGWWRVGSARAYPGGCNSGRTTHGRRGHRARAARDRQGT